MPNNGCRPIAARERFPVNVKRHAWAARDIQQRAFMRLNAIDAAIKREDLRLPPSNRLEALKGNRKGQQSIRINDQWRICFVWREGHAERVEIVDYH